MIVFASKADWETSVRPRVMRNPIPTGAKFRLYNSNDKVSLVFWKTREGDWICDECTQLVVDGGDGGWPVDSRGVPMRGDVTWRTSERG